MLTLLHGSHDHSFFPSMAEDIDLSELISFTMKSDPDLTMVTENDELFEFLCNTPNMGGSFQEITENEICHTRHEEFAGRSSTRSGVLGQHLQDILRCEEFFSSERLENLACPDFDELLENENSNAGLAMPLPPILEFFSPSWVTDDLDCHYAPSPSSHCSDGRDSGFISDFTGARLSTPNSDCDSAEYDQDMSHVTIQRLEDQDDDRLSPNSPFMCISKFKTELLQENSRCWEMPVNYNDKQSGVRHPSRQPPMCQRRPGRPPKKNFSYASSSSDGESEICSSPNHTPKRLGGNKSTHLWEFIRRLLDNPDYSPDCIKWENKDQGVWRIVPGKSKVIANLWGIQKKNPKMNFDKLARSLRWCRTYGFLSEVPKNCGYPKKLCFRFGERAFEWKK